VQFFHLAGFDRVRITLPLVPFRAHESHRDGGGGAVELLRKTMETVKPTGSYASKRQQHAYVLRLGGPLAWTGTAKITAR
jgi:hypothetical protein